MLDDRFLHIHSLISTRPVCPLIGSISTRTIVGFVLFKPSGEGMVGEGNMGHGMMPTPYACEQPVKTVTPGEGR